MNTIKNNTKEKPKNILGFNLKDTSDLLVKGFFNDDKNLTSKLNNLVVKKAGCTTLISNEKTIYLSLGKKAEFTTKLFDKYILEGLCYGTDYSLTFDLNTFINDQVKDFKVLNHFMRIYYLTATYKPLNYKTNEKKEDKEETEFKPINLVLKTSQTLVDTFKSNKILYQNVIYCRNLQDMSPNILTSEFMATKIAKDLKNHKNIDIEILTKKEIVKEKMNLLLSVNAGSPFEPRVIILKYLNNPKSKDITTFIGKGITFDTGGYSLKPSAYMKGMKYDMSGAAVVCSTIKAISELDLKVNVIGMACMTDNLIGKTATLVESVITSKSGKTVEITNTDAEGRLVVADGITYAIEKFKPKRIIELSTLTGAISVTLGDWMTGAFTSNDELFEEFKKASEWTHEPIWRLPVTEENHSNMKSKIADLVNASKDWKGGSSNAAAFLFNFSEKTPFMHLDIAGTATISKIDLGSGVMIRTLIRFLENLSK